MKKKITTEEDDDVNPEDPYVGQGCLSTLLYLIFGFGAIVATYRGVMGLYDREPILDVVKYAGMALVFALCAYAADRKL